MVLPPNNLKFLNSKRKNDNSKNSNPPIFKTKKEQLLDISKNESYNSEDSEEEIDGRQENSLCQLTKNFIRYIRDQNKSIININEIVEKLKVKKRRIYDITNVLQGIGYIKKRGKNEIIWIQKKRVKKNNLEQSYNIKEYIKELKEKNKDLSDTIGKFREEFNWLSNKKDFQKYAYITLKDICRMSLKEKIDILVIKTVKGSLVTVIDKEDCRKACLDMKKKMIEGKIPKNEKLLNNLKNSHQIFIDSINELKLYRVFNGSINEIIKNPKNKLMYSKELSKINKKNILNQKIFNLKINNFEDADNGWNGVNHGISKIFQINDN